MMKKSIIAVALICHLPMKSHATGIPVVDVSAIAAQAIHYVELYLYWESQLDKMVKQVDQLKSTHEAFNGVRNLGDIFDNPALNQYLPDDWNQSYRALKLAGYSGLAAKSLEIYKRNHIHDPCLIVELQDMRVACESRQARAAINAADSDSIYETILARTLQLKQLQGQINTAADPKAIYDLQARIAVEHAAIQNESVRLDALRLVQDSDRALQEQQQREFVARTFSATKGTLIEPLSFD